MGEKPDIRKKRRRALKYGKIRIADSTVVKGITWPHELMYNSGGEPVIYEHISMPQFVTGYLSVLDIVKSGGKQVMLKYLKELMADASTYGWESVRAYYGVWLQQLENGWAEWDDADLQVGV